MKKPTFIENTKLGEHIYCVTIGTRRGEFKGIVECQEEDYCCESQYFGWELAELKAEIAWARAERNYYGAQLKAMVEFWRNMSATRTYDPNAFWVKKLRIEIDSLKNSKKYWTTVVKDLKAIYHSKITTFDALNAARRRAGL